jgi:hypothetical protein
VLTRVLASAVTLVAGATWLVCPPSASASRLLLAEQDIDARHARLSSLLSRIGVPCETVDSRFNGFVRTAATRPETWPTMWSVDCSGIGWFSVVVAGDERDSGRVVGYCGPETTEWWGSLPCLRSVVVAPREAPWVFIVPAHPRWPDDLVLPGPYLRPPRPSAKSPPRRRDREPRRPSQIQQGIPLPLIPPPR